MSAKNSIELTGWVANLKELESGSKTFGLSVGVKTGKKNDDGTDEFKNGFVNVIVGKDIAVEAKTQVTVKGFVVFNFWTPKNSDKERADIQVRGMEVSPYVKG